MQHELLNPTTQSRPQSRLQKFLRDRFIAQLQPLAGGSLTLIDAWGTERLGSEGSGLAVEISVRDSRFYELVAKSGSVGAGESYALGHWSCSDLVALIRLMAINTGLVNQMEGGLAKIGGLLLRALMWTRRNTRSGAKKNIAAHYDLGNQLFELFLDKRMMYSSAVFRSSEDSLDQAQEEKLHSICRKLDLRAEDHVIEIGSGWGGFAVFAAKNYGCRVTTTTISDEQFEFSKALVAEHGLQDRVTIFKKDYRDLQGTYDKLVSIEMIEAVGEEYLGTYLEKCCNLLKPDGVACIQAITIEDHRYRAAVRSVDFIKQFIFPGSFIPSISVIMDRVANKTDFRLESFEEIGLSYAKTLAIWRQRFLSKHGELLALGYDEEFIRLWDFYFAYCEGGFTQRSIGAAQLCFTRSANIRQIPGRELNV